jgi:Flp pilus assembly protein TadG
VRRQAGQALLEFALIVPLLVGVAVGTIGIGRLLWCEQVVGALASDAARAGALGSSSSDARERANARATQMAEDAQLRMDQLRVSVDTTEFGRGGWVEVDATYALLTPTWIGPDQLQAITVQASAREPVDRFRSGVQP